MDTNSPPNAGIMASSPSDEVIGRSTSNQQHQWLIQIKHHLPRDLDHVFPISSCIFPVPSPLASTKPESFAPQLIAIGPFHHFLNALMLMETFKLGAAKRARISLQLPDFPDLVQHLEALAPEVRACYAKHLPFSDHVLAWIMCIDGLFLLELLAARGNILNFDSSGRSRVQLDPSETTKVQSSVLADIVKLENQIPIFVLQEISRLKRYEAPDADENQIPISSNLETEVASGDDEDDDQGYEEDEEEAEAFPAIVAEQDSQTFNSVAAAAAEISSSENDKVAKAISDSRRREILSQNWALPEEDYEAIPVNSSKSESEVVSSSDPFPFSQLVEFCVEISPFQARDDYPDPTSEGIEPRHLLDLLYHLILLMGIPKPKPSTGARPAAGRTPSDEEPMSSAVSGLWQAVGKGSQQLVKSITLPLSFALQLVEIFGISDHLKKLLEDEKSLIPSATKLKSVGVRFKAVTTVRHIGFQTGEKTLNLTEFNWINDQTTGTVLRNLIAYESVARSESPILAGYCELMHSLVRTAEDVAVLMEAGVIRVVREDDEKKPEVFVALFKELRESGEAKDKRVSETVAGVNGYYNGVLKVKLKATGKKCLQYGWKILMVLAVVLLLGLFTVQTVCQVTDCKNLFKISSPDRPTASSVLALAAPFAGGLGKGENMGDE